MCLFSGLSLFNSSCLVTVYRNFWPAVTTGPNRNIFREKGLFWRTVTEISAHQAHGCGNVWWRLLTSRQTGRRRKRLGTKGWAATFKGPFQVTFFRQVDFTSQRPRSPPTLMAACFQLIPRSPQVERARVRGGCFRSKP